MKKTKFNKEEIFKAVDESNKRFENYTPEQRKSFVEEIRKKRNELLLSHLPPGHFKKASTTEPLKFQKELLDRMVQSIRDSHTAMTVPKNVGKATFRVDELKRQPVPRWWKEGENTKKINEDFKREYEKSYQSWLESYPVMLNYHKKGFVKTKPEIDALHMAYSPYKVPEGLTKKQIHQKIKDYHDGIRASQFPLVGNRVEICINGKCLLGTSIPGTLANDKELIDFLEELVKVLKAPKIPFRD
jgi:hypothetical protein